MNSVLPDILSPHFECPVIFEPEIQITLSSCRSSSCSPLLVPIKLSYSFPVLRAQHKEVSLSLGSASLPLSPESMRLATRAPHQHVHCTADAVSVNVAASSAVVSVGGATPCGCKMVMLRRGHDLRDLEDHLAK